MTPRRWRYGLGARETVVPDGPPRLWRAQKTQRSHGKGLTWHGVASDSATLGIQGRLENARATDCFPASLLIWFSWAGDLMYLGGWNEVDIRYPFSSLTIFSLSPVPITSDLHVPQFHPPFSSENFICGKPHLGTHRHGEIIRFYAVGITNSRSQLPTRWRSALASSRGSEKTSSPWWTSVKKKVTDMIHIYIHPWLVLWNFLGYGNIITIWKSHGNPMCFFFRDFPMAMNGWFNHWDLRMFANFSDQETLNRCSCRSLSSLNIWFWMVLMYMRIQKNHNTCVVLCDVTNNFGDENIIVQDMAVFCDIHGTWDSYLKLFGFLWHPDRHSLRQRQ